MNLPEIIKKLVEAQNNYDSVAYANCFSETAVVLDEGNTYTGKVEIKNWIEKANKEYKIIMKPLEYHKLETKNVLSAEVSGNFDGSPIVLKYHHTFENKRIQTLNITT